MLKSKNLKRILSIMMALVFCLFAATQTLIAAESVYELKGTIDSVLSIMSDKVEWNKTDTTGKIEIQLQSGGDGAIFTAYKLLNIEKDSGTDMLKVSIPPEMQAFWDDYTGQPSATVSDIKTTIDPLPVADKSNSIVNSFVDFAPKPTGTTSAAAVDGKTVITTDFGFYAILQTEAPVNGHIASAPVLACLPMQDPDDDTTWLSSFTIVPKDDTISVTKKVKATGDTDFVDETITNINDTVTYEIVAELPEYGADIINSGITYTLEDIIPDGVTVKDTTLKIELWNKTTGAYVEDTTLAAHTYTPAATPEKAKLNVSFSASNYKNEINKKYDKIRITYDADLNKDAVIEGEGNVNEVTLTYSSKAGATATTKADAKVYTMGLDISKVDKNGGAALSGAEFEVHKQVDGSDAAIQFVDITGADNIKRYRVATQAEIDDPLVTTTTTIKVTDTEANKGKLMLDGLNDTTYYLKETTAPIGYNLPKNTFAIEVKPTEYTNESKPGDYTTAANTELSFDVNRQAEKIENATGIDLPVTGGIGTVLFTVIGLLLMAGAAYFLFFSRKKSN